MRFSIILLASLLTGIAHSTVIPSALDYSLRESLPQAEIQKRMKVHGDCEKLKQFFDQTSRDWKDHNTDNDDLRHAYYVTEGVSRLHSHFDDLSEAFQDSAIWAAFAKDKWSLTFHPGKDEQSTGLKVGMITATFFVAVAFAFATTIGPLQAGSVSSATALWSAGQSSLNTFNVHKDHSFIDAADLGVAIGELVIAASKVLVNVSNLVMQGGHLGTSGDIREFLRGGYWVEYEGLDRSKLVDNLAGFLLANAINRIWRTHAVYILGGPKCDRDDDGSDFDPEHNYCYKNKSYRLQRWQLANGDDEPNGHPVGPFGADELGRGAYRYVKIADVIKASVDAYDVAGYEYTNTTAQARVEDALTKGWANPGAQGPSWEGTFTIPVCDVGEFFKRSSADTYKEGYDWREGICSGDKDQTKRFMKAANREGWYKQVGGFFGDHKDDLN